MLNFTCCGVITQVRPKNGKKKRVMVRDQFRDVKNNKIGIESYEIEVSDSMFNESRAVVGDTVAAVGEYSFYSNDKFRLQAKCFVPINQLLIHNLLVQFSQQLSAIEEFERELDAFNKC